MNGRSVRDDDWQSGRSGRCSDRNARIRIASRGVAIQGSSETWAELHLGLAVAQSGIALLSGTSCNFIYLPCDVISLRVYRVNNTTWIGRKIQ